MEASGGGDTQRKSVTLALSKEHNPTIYEERIRIQRAGGTVRYAVHLRSAASRLITRFTVCMCVF